MSALQTVLVANASVIAEGAEHGEALPFPPYVFAVIVFAVFTFLGFVVWSFRDVANRHSQRTGGATGHAHGDRAGTTTTTEHD